MLRGLQENFGQLLHVQLYSLCEQSIPQFLYLYG